MFRILWASNQPGYRYFGDETTYSNLGFRSNYLGCCDVVSVGTTAIRIAYRLINQ